MYAVFYDMVTTKTEKAHTTLLKRRLSTKVEQVIKRNGLHSQSLIKSHKK